jgi:putrescine transport system permease protein
MNINFRRLFLICVPYAWLVALFLIPFGIIFRISLSDTAIAIPPYTPVLDPSGGWAAVKEFFGFLDFENYAFLLTDDLYWKSYLSSLKIAVTSTLLTLVVAFPIAYGIARAPTSWRHILLMMVILPFWTSFLIRVYSWMGILANDGFLNNILMWIGLVDEPLRLMNTNIAVYIGIVFTYLPFMILPIYSNLEKMNPSLLEAAQDLGCSRLSAFWAVTFPMARPGIIAGCLLVFIPTIGEFVIPSLLGGSSTNMIGKVLWNEFFSNRDWPVASAVAVILLALLIFPIVYFQRTQQRENDQ